MGFGSDPQIPTGHGTFQHLGQHLCTIADAVLLRSTSILFHFVAENIPTVALKECARFKNALLELILLTIMWVAAGDAYAIQKKNMRNFQ